MSRLTTGNVRLNNDALNIVEDVAAASGAPEVAQVVRNGPLPVLIYVEVYKTENVTRYEIGSVGCFAVTGILMR